MAYTADQRNDVLETWWKPYWKSRHWARGIPRWCYHSKIQEVLLFSLSKSKTFRAVFFQDPYWHNSDETPVCAGDLVKGKAGEHGIKDHCFHRWSWLRVLCETFKPIIIKHKKANETFTSKRTDDTFKFYWNSYSNLKYCGVLNINSNTADKRYYESQMLSSGGVSNWHPLGL